MNKRKMIFLLSIIILVSFVLLVFNYITGRGKDVINIVSAPKDAILILDEHNTIKAGKHKLPTGLHTIKAKRSGFEEQTKQFNTNETNIVWFNLKPNSEEGYKYVQKHSDEYDEVYEIANIQTSKRVSDKVSKYPIIKKLPFNVFPLFIINYGQSKKYSYDDLKLALYITADNPDGKQNALKYIYSQGYDPTDYEIIFVKSSDKVEQQNEGTGIGEIYDAGEAVENHPEKLYEQGTR